MTQFMLRSRGAQATVLANSEERFLSGREPRVNGGRWGSSGDATHGLDDRDFLHLCVLDNPFHTARLPEINERMFHFLTLGWTESPGHSPRPPTKGVANQLTPQRRGRLGSSQALPLSVPIWAVAAYCSVVTRRYRWEGIPGGIVGTPFAPCPRDPARAPSGTCSCHILRPPLPWKLRALLVRGRDWPSPTPGGR